MSKLLNISSELFINIMIEYVLAILIVLAVALLFKCVVRPKKLYNRYLHDLKSMGYKVYNEPFQAFGIPFFKIIQKDQKQGDALKICKTIYTDNDVVIANSFSSVVLDFTHPDFIKDFYSNQHLYTFPKIKFFTDPIVRAMGRGIPFSEGEEWKRKRKIINAVFNFDFVKSMTYKIEKLCAKAIKDVEESAVHTHQNGEHIVQYDVIDLTVRMFSNVVLECFLGGVTDVKLEGKPLCLFMNQLIADVTQQGFDPLAFLLGVKFLKLGLRAKDRQISRRLKLFKDWGLQYIQIKIKEAKKKLQQQSNGKRQPDDIIQALLRSRSNKQDEHQYYSDAQILQEFSTFFVAGTDTTSHYVMTMIYYIAQNPPVQQKLRSQIDKYMHTNDYSYENLKNLTYIDWIQKETTRMYGPINSLFLREAKEDNYLNQLAIKKGTIVTLQHMGNHYSTKYFKDPFTFRPERWEKQCDDIPPFALGGFSAGARTCIGKHLVSIESKIGLIKFMQRYKKIIIPDGPLKMVIKFVYSPQYFKSKLVIDQRSEPQNSK